MPKVSIVTPCFNSAAFVERTLKSVRAQTFQDWEHMVVDDGSADDSALVVQSCLAADTRLKLICQVNGGVCSARNKGLAACSSGSDYIYFLDADDCLDPEFLAVMVEYLDRNPQVGMAYCGYQYIDSDDALMPTSYAARCVPAGLGVRRLPPDQALTPFISIFCGAPVLPGSCLIRRSVYEHTPGWDESFGQHHEELDLFLNFALLREIHYVHQPLLLYRQHPAQSTKRSEQFETQQKKLDTKWDNPGGLTPEQRVVVKEAWRFREERMVPYTGFLAGTRHLHQRQFALAARFYLGAIKRYFNSFRPHRTSRFLEQTNELSQR